MKFNTIRTEDVLIKAILTLSEESLEWHREWRNATNESDKEFYRELYDRKIEQIHELTEATERLTTHG